MRGSPVVRPLLLVLLLHAVGCAHTATRPAVPAPGDTRRGPAPGPSGGAPAPPSSSHSASGRAGFDGAANRQGHKRSALPHAVRFETAVTYTASLVHFIDSLAATSGGKTIRTYQRLWLERVGRLTPEDRQALVEFREVRASKRATEICGDADPQETVDPGIGWRIRLLLAALKATELEDFYRSLEPCLTSEEMAKLEGAIERFRPGFDLFWEESGYLYTFEAEFREYLDEGAIPGYLASVAGFYDVEPSMAPPPVLCFVLLPVQGPTHAQEVGRRLMIEIRPHDVPTDQLSVVCHESSHFFYDLLPASRREGLLRRARAASPHGEEAWRLMQEALPTALGQGLAVARLAPTKFDYRGLWYHIPQIDRYAKQLYPIVRREIDAGRTIDGPFLEEAIRAYGSGGGRRGD